MGHQRKGPNRPRMSKIRKKTADPVWDKMRLTQIVFAEIIIKTNFQAWFVNLSSEPGSLRNGSKNGASVGGASAKGE
jgi:hypothetical protein